MRSFYDDDNGRTQEGLGHSLNAKMSTQIRHKGWRGEVTDRSANADPFHEVLASASKSHVALRRLSINFKLLALLG